MDLSVEGALAFRDQPFVERYRRLGDEAEGVFESVFPRRFARYGLDRPAINLDFVPPFVRFSPDYITTDGFVEVQGMGRDHLFKLKHDKLDALCQWNRMFPTLMFVWDRTGNRYGSCGMPALYVSLMGQGIVGCFEGNKPYRALHVDALPVSNWTVLE
jgi:hypothetical protein